MTVADYIIKLLNAEGVIW